MDIVDRLREEARYAATGNNAATNSDRWKPEEFQAWTAADEIERLRSLVKDVGSLRAALRKIIDIGDASSGSDWGDLTTSREIARVALEQSPPPKP